VTRQPKNGHVFNVGFDRISNDHLHASIYAISILVSLMAPKTTPTKKAIICMMKKAGFSHDDIRTALPDRHDISDRQINCIFVHYGDKENYYNVGHSSGWSHKLTPHDT